MANQVNTSHFQPAHDERRPPWRSRTAIWNGQLVWVIEKPCQPLAFATSASAARQWPAWLSPTSATVSVAVASGPPNEQTGGSLWPGNGGEGVFGGVLALGGGGGAGGGGGRPGARGV